MSNQKEISNYGLFWAKYHISNGLIGGVSLDISLAVNTPEKTVSGTGHVFQPVSPPLNVISSLKGDYSYMATMKSTHILVVAEGNGGSIILIQGVPQIIENLRLRMSLEEDWQSGTATYEFFYNGEWRSSGVQTVKIVETAVPNTAELAETVKRNESVEATV